MKGKEAKLCLCLGTSPYMSMGAWK